MVQSCLRRCERFQRARSYIKRAEASSLTDLSQPGCQECNALSVRSSQRPSESSMHGQDRLVRRLARILTNRAAAPGRAFEIEFNQLFLSDSGSENFFPYERSIYSKTAARRVWHCYRTPSYDSKNPNGVSTVSPGLAKPQMSGYA